MPSILSPISGRRIAAALAAALLAGAAACTATAPGTAVTAATDTFLPARNPFLADSFYPIGHTNPAQVDSTLRAGPNGPTRRLQPQGIAYVDTIGLAHYGTLASGPYADGRRVLWTSGADRIAKLDYQTLKVLGTYPLPGKPQVDAAQIADMERQLSTLTGPARLQYAAQKARVIQGGGLEGVYTLLDRDNNFYVGGRTGVTVYGDARAGDPDSAIVVRRTWQLPQGISGRLIGMNMTYDGWLVLATDAGDLMVVARDFSRYHTVRLAHSEEAAAYNRRMAAEGRVGYGWVRNGFAVDAQGGIYVVANGWMEKVVWRSKRLSVDPGDGAWAEPYPNSTGTGSGSTPALMGFGKDRFVVITDGDALMNIILYWRDRIPADAKAVPGASSRRVAGKLPVNMCDARRTALQSEQAVVVGGYGAIVVNNEPASMPPGFLRRYNGLLVGILGDDPAYTPHGMEKFQWNPATRQFERAWCNTEIASPNAVPFISLASNRVYTVGVRDRQWTLEGLDYASGRSAFHYVLGGVRYNSSFSGVTIDADGRAMFGALFGLLRITVPPSAAPVGEARH